MKPTMEFDYYYGAEADQFRFFRIPKVLFEKPCFKELRCEAKLLYGMMLDQLSLSRKNGWIDEEGRTFIIYTEKVIGEEMGVSADTARKYIRDLEQIGLIEKKRRGQGRADMIYVKNFVKPKKSVSDQKEENVEKSSEPEKLGFLNPKNSVSRNVNFQVLETENFGLNETNRNKTNIYNIYPYPIYPSEEEKDGSDRDEMENDIAMIKKNIEYEILSERYAEKNDNRFEELYQLIVEMVTGKRESLTIGGTTYSQEFIRKRFLSVNHSHVDYALWMLDEHYGEIRNMRKYLIAILFNAPTTMNSYTLQRVKHDMYGSPGNSQEKAEAQ